MQITASPTTRRREPIQGEDSMRIERRITAAAAFASLLQPERVALQPLTMMIT